MKNQTEENIDDIIDFLNSAGKTASEEKNIYQSDLTSKELPSQNVNKIIEDLTIMQRKQDEIKSINDSLRQS